MYALRQKAIPALLCDAQGPAGIATVPLLRVQDAARVSGAAMTEEPDPPEKAASDLLDGLTRCWGVKREELQEAA
jgi:hypothetical protein